MRGFAPTVDPDPPPIPSIGSLFKIIRLRAGIQSQRACHKLGLSYTELVRIEEDRAPDKKLREALNKLFDDIKHVSGKEPTQAKKG